MEVWILTTPTVEGIGGDAGTTTSIRHGVTITDEGEDAFYYFWPKLGFSHTTSVARPLIVSFFRLYGNGDGWRKYDGSGSLIVSDLPLLAFRNHQHLILAVLCLLTGVVSAQVSSLV